MGRGYNTQFLDKIFAVLYVSIMGLTRCYKTTVFHIYICNFSTKFILQSERSRRSNCVTVPNFVEIARTMAEIIMAICRFIPARR